ncbi:hypothetical protein V6N13_121854 [Hibiscus sabdariffa]
MQNLKKEARATLELGKKLGVKFVGDEEEEVVELGWSVDFKEGACCFAGEILSLCDMASVFYGYFFSFNDQHSYGHGSCVSVVE